MHEDGGCSECSRLDVWSNHRRASAQRDCFYGRRSFFLWLPTGGLVTHRRPRGLSHDIAQRESSEGETYEPADREHHASQSLIPRVREKRQPSGDRLPRERDPQTQHGTAEAEHQRDAGAEAVVALTARGSGGHCPEDDAPDGEVTLPAADSPLAPRPVRATFPDCAHLCTG